jgi:hypothetical protein
MGDQRRWAARYQFLDELWRGRDRIVCDPELEAALHAGSEGAVAELVDGLVPGAGKQGRAGGRAQARAWVALHNDRRAASFARARSGTVFVSVADASEIASDEAWQIALVHLGGGAGAGGATTRAGLVGPLESFLEVLGERLEDDPERSVVLSLACGPDEDQSYEQLAELVEELFGDGRIYGLAPASMAAFYDFGPVLEPTGDAEGAGDSPAEGDIEVDNTLGTEAPRFEAFLAIVGAGVPGEGVTFVELPGGVPGSGAGIAGTAGADAPAGDDELAAVRAQLSEAQRRGDLQAIERQSLLEQLEQAEDRIASLEEQLDDHRAQGAAGRASADASAPEARTDPSATELGPRVDALLARERTLRWELGRARGEIERLEARPIAEAEAEIAALRAELDRARADLEAARAEHPPEPDRSEELDELEPDELDALAELAWLLDEAAEAPSAAQTREWERARSTLDHLLRKLERGASISALELHRQLATLKRLL